MKWARGSGKRADTMSENTMSDWNRLAWVIGAWSATRRVYESKCIGAEDLKGTAVRPISLLRLSLLRSVDSKLPGNYLWAWEFHPLKLRLCLSQTFWHAESQYGDWPYKNTWIGAEDLEARQYRQMVRPIFKLRIYNFGVWVKQFLKQKRWAFLAHRLIS